MNEIVSKIFDNMFILHIVDKLITLYVCLHALLDRVSGRLLGLLLLLLPLKGICWLDHYSWMLFTSVSSISVALSFDLVHSFIVDEYICMNFPYSSFATENHD